MCGPMALPVGIAIHSAAEIYDSIGGHPWFEFVFRVVEQDLDAEHEL